MLRRFLSLSILTLAISDAAFGDARLQMDLLDASDGGPTLPPGILAVDFLLDFDDGDAFTLSAFSVSAVNGSELIYALNLDGEAVLTNMGNSDPFVTCLSTPYPRFGTARFEDNIVQTIGRDCPFGPGIIATPTLLAITWYDPRPACWTRPTRDGAVARVAVNLDPQWVCGGSLDCCYSLYFDDLPDGAVPILEGTCLHQGQPFGFVWGTCDRPGLNHERWVLALAPSAGSCRFDLNRDRTIDIADLTVMLSAFGATPADPDYQVALDFDGSQIIDLQDLTLFVGHWGEF